MLLRQGPTSNWIVHLAAVVGGRLTIDGNPLKVATDLAIDATFFNWVVKHRPFPRKVLFFSSSAAYPIAEQSQHHHRPLSEQLIDFNGYLGVPDMTYGWAKLTGEFLARHAVETYGLDVVIYRPFSATRKPGFHLSVSLDRSPRGFRRFPDRGLGQRPAAFRLHPY